MFVCALLSGAAMLACTASAPVAPSASPGASGGYVVLGTWSGPGTQNTEDFTVNAAKGPWRIRWSISGGVPFVITLYRSTGQLIDSFSGLSGTRDERETGTFYLDLGGYEPWTVAVEHPAPAPAQPSAPAYTAVRMWTGTGALNTDAFAATAAGGPWRVRWSFTGDRQLSIGVHIAGTVANGPFEPRELVDSPAGVTGMSYQRLTGAFYLHLEGEGTWTVTAEQVPPIPAQPATRGYTAVKNMSGTAAVRTDAFAVDVANGPWRIRWTVAGGPAASIAVRAAQPFGGHLADELLETASGPSGGTTYVHLGGTFYLEVTAQRPWTVTIERAD
ncbi:MAG TPA: hypothetical protein VF998_03980 [Candidatus Limnocylindria bacterium]